MKYSELMSSSQVEVEFGLNQNVTDCQICLGETSDCQVESALILLRHRHTSSYVMNVNAAG